MVLDKIHSYIFDTEDIDAKVDFGHPWMPPTIVIVYVIFCKWMGPALMRNRRPFHLKNIIIIYNFAQVMANAYIAMELTQLALKIWPARCLANDPKTTGPIVKESKLVQWHVYLIKFVDLADAVFFVLRKKEKQVTFLHLFHHVMMCSLCYAYYKTSSYGYYLVLALIVNTFIHTVMYLYYGLAAFGPEMQKYLWWKKYITRMQIAQFLLVLVYMSHSLYTGCDSPGKFEISLTLFCFVLLILFLNFYRKSFKNE